MLHKVDPDTTIENPTANPPCISEHFKHFIFFVRENIFLADKGFAPPPPLAEMSAKDAIFFWTAPLMLGYQAFHSFRKYELNEEDFYCPHIFVVRFI